jgi:hypothetical protein
VQEGAGGMHGGFFGGGRHQTFYNHSNLLQ